MNKFVIEKNQTHQLFLHLVLLFCLLWVQFPLPLTCQRHVLAAGFLQNLCKLHRQSLVMSDNTWRGLTKLMGGSDDFFHESHMDSLRLCSHNDYKKDFVIVAAIMFVTNICSRMQKLSACYKSDHLVRILSTSSVYHTVLKTTCIWQQCHWLQLFQAVQYSVFQM